MAAGAHCPLALDRRIYPTFKSNLHVIAAHMVMLISLPLTLQSPERRIYPTFFSDWASHHV